MAWLQQDPSGNYHVSFRLGATKYKRSLKTQKKDKAEGALARIKENLELVERGIVSIPPGADVPRFLLTDGRVSQKPQAETALTLKGLFDAFFAAIPTGHLEESTLSLMRIHQKHLFKHLGEGTALAEVDLGRLQQFVAKRSRAKGLRGKKISGATIKKEIITLRTIWNWAKANAMVDGPFPGKKVKYPKVTEKPPFQTWAEIEKRVEHGGLSEEEQEELWDCLFLSLQEVAELLAHVKEKAQQPFIYPMVVMAAHTGARRSEIIRAQVSDLQNDDLVINERKRVRGKRSTRRVPMSPLLKAALAEWLKVYPGGLFLFCQGAVERSKSKRAQPMPLTPHQAHGYLKRTLAGSKWDKLRGWHVFRHSFISNCALKAVDQRIIDSFVGHTTDEMRRRYTHLFPSARMDAIRSLFG